MLMKLLPLFVSSITLRRFSERRSRIWSRLPAYSFLGRGQHPGQSRHGGHFAKQSGADTTYLLLPRFGLASLPLPMLLLLASAAGVEATGAAWVVSSEAILQTSRGSVAWWGSGVMVEVDLCCAFLTSLSLIAADTLVRTWASAGHEAGPERGRLRGWMTTDDPAEQGYWTRRVPK